MALSTLARALGLIALPLAGLAHAGELSWLERPRATGDWGGARSALEARGLWIHLDYFGEVFGGDRGEGGALTPAYRGTLDLVLAVDTRRLVQWPGGTLLAYAQQAHGHGVSPQLGAVMPLSGLEAPAFTQLSELWYEQLAFGDRLLVRVGKQDANRDFAAPRFPGAFLHSSYGVPPTIPMPSFPAPGLGGVVHVDPTAWLSLRSGVYEGAPRVAALGLGTAFDRGAFVIASVLVRHAIGAHTEGANYGAGAWYLAAQDGSRASAPLGGGFALADLWIPLERAPEGSARSLQAFARIGWARRRQGTIQSYAGGGLALYIAPTHSTIGAGGGRVVFTPTASIPVAATPDPVPAVTPPAGTPPSTESFVELFCRQGLAAWLTLQPDVQLVWTGRGRPARIGGLRLELRL
jgi:porin